MPEPVAAPLPAVAPEPPSGSALNSFQSEMPSADDGGGGKAARPRSARRPAPKVSSNVVKVEPTVPRGEATAVMRALIAEGAAPPDDDDDGGVEFVSEKGEAMASVGLLKGEGGEGHTKIVKDILETQKAMEEARDADGRQHADAADTRGGGGGGGGIILGRKKAQPGGRETVDRQRSKDEIQKLRADIQALCQSTNPLGKSLEYVHEVRPCPRESDAAPHRPAHGAAFASRANAVRGPAVRCARRGARVRLPARNLALVGRHLTTARHAPGIAAVARRTWTP